MVAIARRGPALAVAKGIRPRRAIASPGGLPVTLAELIQVLEAAKKGSPGLDRLICETVVMVGVARRDNPCLWAAEEGDVIEVEAPTQVYRYTTSVDAALGLVPPAWSWHLRVLYRSDRPTTPVIRAVVFNNATGMVLSSEYCEAEAETAPIALCIAALRARAILQKPPIGVASARRDAL
jgi:hypothetical protein